LLKDLKSAKDAKPYQIMGAKKTTGIVLFALGAVILVLALAADPIGIGGSPGFGRRHILGALLGAVLTVVGLALGYKK
jgi:hypothetical protein